MVGFEFEFRSRTLDKLVGGSDSLVGRAIKLDLGKLGEDGGCYELRTGVVNGGKAAKLMSACLRFLREYNAVTRYNDGVHINISCVRKTDHLRLNPLTVWSLARPHHWAKFFGRHRHIHCRLPNGQSPLEVLEFISATSARNNDQAISFSHFSPKTAPKRSRIEFRYPGGTGYQNNEVALKKCLREAMAAVAGSLMGTGGTR